MAVDAARAAVEELLAERRGHVVVVSVELI
jgi:hypothetical protein